ncbi:Uncharacterized protein TCM_018917 [Theobroma cacao]|uniref:DUF4219 domain-containing protein n=1 Tax=Theobroma cacao TaxID=3641 RepID=A0A061EFT3_THECC|nr:Uncharacterized protein TCM_018917 [Theobroma cacao]
MATTGFSASTPLTFTGKSYRVWVVKMRSYLKAFDLWDVVKNGEVPVQRHANPTIAQIKQYSKEVAKRFMQAPSVHHFTAAKRIWRYVKGTASYGLRFLKFESCDLQGFTDIDWAGSVDKSKSTRGYCFSFRSGVFTWSSRKQEVVAQASAEAKYIATVAAANHALWLKKVLADLNFLQEKGTLIRFNN